MVTGAAKARLSLSRFDEDLSRPAAVDRCRCEDGLPDLPQLPFKMIGSGMSSALKFLPDCGELVNSNVIHMSGKFVTSSTDFALLQFCYEL